MVQQPDPSVGAYLGAITALMQLWQQVGDEVRRAYDADTHVDLSPFVERLLTIDRATRNIHVPQACEGVQAALLTAMQTGVDMYIHVMGGGSSAAARAASRNFAEDMAIFETELARLKARFRFV